MNKYKRDSQSDVRFFCWLIGFSRLVRNTNMLPTHFLVFSVWMEMQTHPLPLGAAFGVVK